jgi:hypothetical protein
MKATNEILLKRAHLGEEEGEVAAVEEAPLRFVEQRPKVP